MNEKENICLSCKFNGNCSIQKRVDVDEVICCVGYEEDKWIKLSEEMMGK